MGLKQGESIDEELYVTDTTNESVSGSVSGTAGGAKSDEGSGNSGEAGASAGGTTAIEEPVTPAKRQPKIARCLYRVGTGRPKSPEDVDHVQNIVREEGSGISRSRFPGREDGEGSS